MESRGGRVGKRFARMWKWVLPVPQVGKKGLCLVITEVESQKVIGQSEPDAWR